MICSPAWGRYVRASTSRHSPGPRVAPSMQRTQGRARNARIEVFLEECCHGGRLGPQRVCGQRSFGGSLEQQVVTLERLELIERPEGSYATVAGARREGCQDDGAEFHLHMDKVRRIEMYYTDRDPMEEGESSARITRFLSADGDVLMSWHAESDGGLTAGDLGEGLPTQEGYISNKMVEDAWGQIHNKYGQVQEIRP